MNSTLQIVLAVASVAAAFGGLSLYWRTKERRLQRERAGEGFEEFRAHFRGEHVPDHILSETYRYLQRFTRVQNFPVRPSDELGRVYGIWNEDLDDTFMDLAKMCGCEIPPAEELRRMNPVRTVEGLVRLLSRLHPAGGAARQETTKSH